MARRPRVSRRQLRGPHGAAVATRPADRDAGVLFVNAIHEDVAFTKATRRAVDDEIE